MTRKATIKFVTAIAALGAATLTLGAHYARGSTEPSAFATSRITRGDIVDTVAATGTLEAVTTVQVGSQLSGTVQALYADFNSIVRKGQVIARLDPSLYETQVEQARANLIRAEADADRLSVAVTDAETKLARARDLSEQQLIPAVELESAIVGLSSAQAQLRSATAQVTQARASLNQAEVNLDKTVITAPIDGIVIARNVDVGQTVAASLQAPTLYVIAADLTKMRVSASIDESAVGRVQPGQPVTFRVDAFPAESFAGTVSQVRLNPVTVQNVVTYVGMIDVANPELKLKPGMTATVTIEIQRRNGVLRAPAAALRFRPTAEMLAALGLEPASGAERNSLWVETSAGITPVRVSLGLSDGAHTEILDGDIREGAAVITGTSQTTSGSGSAGSAVTNPLMGMQPARGVAAGRGGPGGGQP
jgi:HlyD family secretion protein